VKERPILFSAPMVRAILAGKKTQTRRIVLDTADHYVSHVGWLDGGSAGPGWYLQEIRDVRHCDTPVRCRYGAVGDRLWVRETWLECGAGSGRYDYRADTEDGPARWRPSIHMPRRASRLTLEKLGGHWKRVPQRGLPWQAFLRRVENLPAGQLWRHNVAGDLPGRGDELDVDALGELVDANRGRRGFTFTHKTGPENHEAIQAANLAGFTVNLSADTLEEADTFFQDDACYPPMTKAGPVVVLLPSDAPDSGTRTPKGRHVVVCPAETSDRTCADCGACANPWRHSIIGFRAHGQFRAHVPELVRLRRKAAAA
jgi:hypothetical protein